MAHDSSYRPSVYREQGGNRWVVDAGGEALFASGSKTTRYLISATEAISLAASLSGARYLNKVKGVIYTLPAATAAGNGASFHINLASGGHSATAGEIDFKLRPQSADKVYGAGVAGATDSEVIHCLGTGSVVGDGLEVWCDGANWIVTNRTGTYTRGAAT